MSRWLTCSICGQRKPVGIMSMQAWGRLELPPDLEVEHPGLGGTTLHACPTCIERHPDWNEQLHMSLGIDYGSAGELSAAQ